MPNHAPSAVKTSPNPAPSPTELITPSRTAASAPAESEELLEQLMQQLAHELLAKKSAGQPLSGNLPLLDRLMRYASYKLRREALRLRQNKAAQKSASAKHPPTSATPPTERPSDITDPKIVKFPDRPVTALKPDQTLIGAALRQAANNSSEFRIDPKLTALPLMGEEPMVATKTYDLIQP